MDQMPLVNTLVIFAVLNTALPLVMVVLPGLRSMPRPGIAAATG